MAATQPKLKSNELIARLDDLADLTPNYLNRDSLEVGRIDREIRALLQADPVQGWTLRGVFSAMVGDEAALREAFTAFSKISTDSTSTINFAGSFATLGYFSQAQEILAPAVDARRGEFSSVCDMGAQLGMFNRVAREIEVANTMKMHISTVYRGVRDCPLAASILADAGVTDEEVAAQLDALGEVLRMHRRPAGHVSIDARNVEQIYTGVSIQYYLREASHPDVFQMNLELSAVAEKRGLRTHDNLVILFASEMEPA